MKKNLFAVSMTTLACLYGLLAAILILVCAIADVPILAGIVSAIIVLILQFLLGPFFTDLTMKLFYKVKYDQPIPDYLQAFIEKVCADHNMKIPRIGYIDDGAPNAFTYGRTKNDARVVLTRGIFELLDEEEVKAVVAHELGHASHYDMLIMTVAQLVPLVLYGIYEVCTKSDSTPKAKVKIKGSSSKNDSERNQALVGLIAYVLYLVCQYIILWLSRQREYFADQFSAEETGNPNALASALVRIGFGLNTRKSNQNNKRSTASPSTLGISDAQSSSAMTMTAYSKGEPNPDSIRSAMKWDLWNVWAKLYEINATHPLTSKRLLALGDLAKGMGQEPYVTFDLQKPESYLDDFAKELAITILPSLVMIAGLIGGFVLLNNPDKVSIGMCTLGLGLAVCMLFSLLKHRYRHPMNRFDPTNVEKLLDVVKVSKVTPVPCEVNGAIIGRGNPGCIFNEDFVLRDETGIMLLDYNRPLTVLNKIFALFKSKEYFDKTVKVTGWYRRCPTPYVEVYTMETDGQIKKLSTVLVGYIVRWVVFALALAFSVFCLVI